MVDVTILCRQECHPCEVALEMARRLQAQIPFYLRWVDVDQDPSLRQRFGDRIPVVLIEGRETLTGEFAEQEFRRAVKRARWRRPISRILSRLRLPLTRG